MGDRWLAILPWHGHLPDAKMVLRHRGRIAVPVVEVADEVRPERVGRPFSVYNVAIVLDVEAILLEPLWQLSVLELPGRNRWCSCPCELLHAAFRLVYCLQPLPRLRIATAEAVFEGREPRVELDDACKKVVSQLNIS